MMVMRILGCLWQRCSMTRFGAEQCQIVSDTFGQSRSQSCRNTSLHCSRENGRMMLISSLLHFFLQRFQRWTRRKDCCIVIRMSEWKGKGGCLCCHSCSRCHRCSTSCELCQNAHRWRARVICIGKRFRASSFVAIINGRASPKGMRALGWSHDRCHGYWMKWINQILWRQLGRELDLSQKMDRLIELCWAEMCCLSIDCCLGCGFGRNQRWFRSVMNSMSDWLCVWTWRLLLRVNHNSLSQPWRNYTRNHGKCRGEKHRENRFAILFLTPLLLVSLNNSLHVIETRTCEMYHPDAQLPKHDQSSVKFREGEFTSIKL